MNEQLQQALTAILNKTMSGVDAGVSFLSAEIPEVIQQLLIYKMVSACIFMAVGVAMIVGAYKMTERGIKNYKEESEKGIFREDEMRFILPFFAAVILWFFGVILIAANVETVIQIWLAPKIYLIEYAASLAK